MNILLCGASGFMGRAIGQALRHEGHRVIATHSPSRHTLADAMPVDFAKDTDVATWLPRLVAIDAVVNAVGVLRDTPGRPMQAVHQDTPRALFQACAQAGVRRVIQVSALGIEGNRTRYAQTKLAADQCLLALTASGQLDGLVLRPSLVFGRGGDSSELFMLLARSPVVGLPLAVLQGRVQPVSLPDLAEAVTRLLGATSEITGVLACVGPQPMRLGEFVACLRAQQGRRPARVFGLPQVISRWSARLGDHLHWAPWCSETEALLAQDNVGAPEPFARILGRAPTPPDQFMGTTWS